MKTLLQLPPQTENKDPHLICATRRKGRMLLQAIWIPRIPLSKVVDFFLWGGGGLRFGILDLRFGILDLRCTEIDGLFPCFHRPTCMCWDGYGASTG